MNRKVIIIILLLVICAVSIFPLYGLLRWGGSASDYFRYSRNLTQEEEQYLAERGSLIYVADSKSHPLRYIDEADGQYKGFSIDYMNLLSLELGISIEFRPMSWDRAVTSIKTGEFYISDMFESESRKENMLFSLPVYNLRGVAASYKYRLNSLDDIEGATVAVEKNTYAEEYLRERYKEIDYIYTNDVSESVELLNQRKVDVIVGVEPVVMYFLSGENSEAVIFNEPLFQEDVKIAVPKGEEQFLKIINKGIYSLSVKDSVNQIYNKWFGISIPGQERKENLLKWIFTFYLVVVLAVFIFYFIFISNQELKKKVDVKTQQLLEKEQEVFQSQKMASIGQLAAAISHEIRNPLAVIRNHIYLIKLQRHSENVRLEKSLEVMEKELEKANQIVSELLSFSRKTNDTPTDINLNRYFKELFEVVDKKGKTIELELYCSEEHFLLIKKDILDYIFMNLLNNAVDAIDDRGIIIVRVSVSLNRKEYIITVEDSGCGIAPGDMSRIFDPFFTTKADGEGTGLGLPIVYNQVKNLGGTIKAQSDGSKGTVFTICLPAGENNV